MQRPHDLDPGGRAFNIRGLPARKFDRAAVRYFDNTPEAFWQSFYAAALALPAVLLVLLTRKIQSMHRPRRS